jgi:hypothetical protein
MNGSGMRLASPSDRSSGGSISEVLPPLLWGNRLIIRLHEAAVWPNPGAKAFCFFDRRASLAISGLRRRTSFRPIQATVETLRLSPDVSRVKPLEFRA